MWPHSPRSLFPLKKNKNNPWRWLALGSKITYLGKKINKTYMRGLGKTKKQTKMSIHCWISEWLPMDYWRTQRKKKRTTIKKSFDIVKKTYISAILLSSFLVFFFLTNNFDFIYIPSNSLESFVSFIFLRDWNFDIHNHSSDFLAFGVGKKTTFCCHWNILIFIYLLTFIMLG